MTEEEETDEEEDYYLFKSKKGGWVTISRHLVPDFCAGMTEKQIEKEYVRKKVRI